MSSTTTSNELVMGEVGRLEQVVDRRALAEVCRSFHDLFALPVRVFSAEGVLLADAHEEQAVCAYVNGLANGRAACTSVVDAVKRLEPDGGSVTHPCFTGAEYRVVPMVYQGRRIGRFVIGPYVPAEMKEVPRSLLVLDSRIDPEKSRGLLGQMPRVRADTLIRIEEHFSRILDLILFSGHRAFLTSQMHVASVRQSYRELAEKNDSLQEAYDRLKELDRLKSNFLATVSHELRTPLTSIIGYSDMLAAGIAGELVGEQKEFVETIRSKGDHLLALITSLLDLNKLEQGTVRVERERLDAKDMLRELQKTFAPAAAKKGIKLVVEVEPDVPPLWADPVRIRQVLFNLTENAIKFTPAGGTVRFVAREGIADPEGDGGGMGAVLLLTPRRALEIRIVDSGVGISEVEHARIFDAFYQVDGGSTREHGGTGLGLSIVKRLVEAHGGTIQVESEAGQGASFIVTIPEPEEP